MKDILDKLIADAPDDNQGAVELQIQIGALQYAGALRPSDEFDGLYELMTIAQKPSTDGRSAVPFALRIVFRPEAVTAVFIPAGEQETSNLYVPKRGNIVPGIA